MKTIINNLNTSKRRYEKSINIAKARIYSFVDFDFEIEYQPDNGWVLLSVETAEVAPLKKVLFHMDRHGLLVYAKFKRMVI